MSDLLGTATALIARLEEMQKPINDICVFAWAHGFKYKGPSWAEPLRALKQVVAEIGREPHA